MGNCFIELSENELMVEEGGIVILGAAMTAATLAKIGAGVVVVGGVGMFAKGIYDRYNGN